METVDKELVGAVAEVLDRRVVPLFPHEVTPEVVPMSSEAHFRIEMLGVDAEAGLAFISYAWGGGPAGGALVLKHIDGAWVSIYGQR